MIGVENYGNVSFLLFRKNLIIIIREAEAL